VLQSIRDSIRQVQARKSELEKALSERDVGLNQFQINWMLVWAVFGMIATILTLFILMRWYPTALTDLLIEQRVFVEVLSMGFLLVTVIILGSAKLIMGEGLSGLLGTIAGYIFAKKTSELLGPKRAASGQHMVERRLAQAHLAVADLESQLKSQKTAIGDSPTEAQKLAIGKLEAALSQAEDTVEKLSNSLVSLSAAKRQGKPASAQ
jgi:hypothetical protein